MFTGEQSKMKLHNVFKSVVVAATLLSTASMSFSANAQGKGKGYHEYKNNINLQTFARDSGSTYLVRHKNQINARLSLLNLPANHSFTVWWVVFNDPNKCESGPTFCTEIDTINTVAKPAVYFATGFVSNSDGSAQITAVTTDQDTDDNLAVGGANSPNAGGLSRNNGLKAAVQMAVRDHGPIVPGNVTEQTSDFEWGCEEGGWDYVCYAYRYVTFGPVDVEAEDSKEQD